jgi:hypothetical protein
LDNGNVQPQRFNLLGVHRNGIQVRLNWPWCGVESQEEEERIGHFGPNLITSARRSRRSNIRKRHRRRWSGHRLEEKEIVAPHFNWLADRRLPSQVQPWWEVTTAYQ